MARDSSSGHLIQDNPSQFVEEVTKFLAAEGEYDRRDQKRVLDQQCNLYALDLCVAETYGLKAQHSIRGQLQKMGYGEELEKLGKNSLSLEKFVKRATHELNDRSTAFTLFSVELMRNSHSMAAHQTKGRGGAQKANP